MDKVSTGVAGLDLLMGGGYPAGRTSLVFGAAGTGKTLLSVQGLAAGAAAGEPGMFVSFEEDPGDVVRNFGSFCWNLADHVDDGRIGVIDARLHPGTGISGTFEIDGLLGILRAYADRIGARRLVLDGLDVLLAHEPSRPQVPSQLFAIERFARERGIATLITLKAEEIGAGMVMAPYIGDCVLRLDRRMDADVAVNTLEIQKYRGSPTPAVRVPLTVDSDGIVLLYGGGRTVQHQVFNERVTSGIARLDTMLGGGYYRGTTVLISGAPGTAKTTLAGTMVGAACATGARALFVSFDEADAQIVRNLRSVAVDLAPHVASGRLKMLGLRAAMAPAQVHVHHICQAIDAFRPDLLVIDPISALAKAGSRSVVDGLVELLVDVVKSRGITTVFITLVDNEDPEREKTQTHISTIADSWLHLTFVVLGGERNRALTIIKSRGSAHSNQVRELVLGAEGPTLSDVYTAGGQVLMGTARLEKEAEAAVVDAETRYQAFQRRASELEAIKEAQARIAALEAEIKVRKTAVTMLDDLETTISRIGDRRAGAVLKSRHADPAADLDGGQGT